MARVPLARLQLFKSKGRLLAAVAGISCAAMLMLAHMGVSDALFNSAVLVHDKLINKKVAVIQALRNHNHRYAVHVKARLEMAGKSTALLEPINESTTRALVRAYLKELAETIGEKHGFQYGEEFNYHGRPFGQGSEIPPWIEERAKPIPQ